MATAFVVLICACGNKSEPATPSLSDPAHAAVDPAGSAALPAASADPQGPSAGDDRPHRQRKPFPIHSSCSEVVTIVFGEDPKTQGAAGKRTVAPNSAIEGPRDAEGRQTVWLLDDKGEPLVNVHITRGMKQLEIGRSCRTLDAR
jgi:hypothetical protein